MSQKYTVNADSHDYEDEDVKGEAIVPQITLGSLLGTEAIHLYPIDNLFDVLQIDPNLGLDDMQVKINRIRFGKNVFTKFKKYQRWKHYFKCLFGPFEFLLWASAAICFVTYGIEMASSIGTATENVQMGLLLVSIVVLEGSLKFYQETSMQNTIKSVNAFLPQYASVIRQGKRLVIRISELVVGDIVELRPGDKVPADIRIIDGSHMFQVDNSSLTGESQPQAKMAMNEHVDPLETVNMVYFSTTVVDGYAKGIVVGVGDNTTMGETIKLTAGVPERNKPLARDMSEFVSILCCFAVFCGLISIIFSVILGFTWIDLLFFFIAVLLANVPFNVAIFIPVCLVISAKRLASQHCYFKSLEAVETLGSTTVICTDKTGTLTQNSLTVSRLWFNNELVVETCELQPDFNLDTAFSPGFVALARVAVLCNSASIQSVQDDDIHLSNFSRKIEGNAMDKAILQYMDNQRVSCTSIRNNYVKRFEEPFTSENKYHLCVFEERAGDDDVHTGRFVLTVKGAPEKIVELCNRIVIDDVEYEFDSDWATKAQQMYECLAQNGERVLGFCDLQFTADIAEDLAWDESSFLERLDSGLRFVGLISFQDPLRPNTKEAILRCKAAGIKVIMITGDHPLSAKAIARQAGIISQDKETVEEFASRLSINVRSVNPLCIDAIVINGTQLKYIAPTTLQEILRNHSEIVFARMLPSQKLLVTETLQDAGEIVAVTGDGINDAPALKKANIGITIGTSGTEIARESSDLIVMNDSFAAIPRVVEEGRRVFENLKRCCFFGLTDTTPCVLAFMIYMILRVPTPLENIAMLLIAVVIDFLPAVSFAFEKGERDLMTLAPRDVKKDSLVNSRLISACYGQMGMIEALAGFFSYVVVMSFNGFLPSRLLGLQMEWNCKAINDLQDSFGQEWAYSQRMTLARVGSTAFFVAVVFCQMVNAINLKTRRSRLKLRKVFGNPALNAAIILDLILTFVLVYSPGTEIVDMGPLKWICWVLPLPFSILLLVWGQVIRILVSCCSDKWIRHEFSF